MITNFLIENFRCFKQLKVDNIKRVNLITGRNSTGKTSILEAMWMMHGPNGPDIGFRINTFRGFSTIVLKEPLKELFYEYDYTKPIHLEGNHTARGKINYELELEKYREVEHILDKVDNNKIIKGLVPEEQTETSKEIDSERLSEIDTQAIAHYIKITYSDKNIIPTIIELKFQANRLSYIPPNLEIPQTIFVSSRKITTAQEIAERFGQMELKGHIEKITEIIQIVEPNLEKLTLIYSGGVPNIYGTIGLTQPIPIALCGEGMSKLLELVVALGSAQGGTVMIDELENGFHYSILSKIWKALFELANIFDVQLFCTSHSKETILAAVEAVEDLDCGDDFALHRLYQDKKMISAKTYDLEALRGAIKLDWDVRG